jgi:hypothetical protein
MPALTLRKDPDRPDRWVVYFGDISVGSIGRCAGVPGHVDQFEWGCGFPPASNRGIAAGGTAATFEQAREAFGAAWARLEARLALEDFDAYRRQGAWTTWKYARRRSAAADADGVWSRPVFLRY